MLNRKLKHPLCLLVQGVVFLPYLLLFAVGLSLYLFVPWLHKDVYNPSRVVQLVFLLCAALLLFIQAGRVSVYTNTTPLLSDSKTSITGIFFLVAGIGGSLFYSQMPQWSVLDLEHLLLLLCCLWFLKLSFLSFNQKHWQYLGCMIVIVMGVYALRSFMHINAIKPLFRLLDVTPSFANIRMYSDVAAVLMPLSWLILADRTRLITKLLLGIINIYWAWMLITTEARSGILSLAVATLCVALLYGKDGRKALYFFVMVFISALLCYELLPIMAKAGWQRDVTSSNGRWTLWALCWQYFIDAFPFGIGGMMFAADGRYNAAHPHNLVFILVAEWGFFTLLGLTFLLFSLGQVYYKQRKTPYIIETNTTIKIAIVMASISALINAMFAGSHVASPFGTLVLLLAWSAYLAITSKKSSSNALSTKNIRIICVLFIAVWLHAAWLSQQLYFLSESSRIACAAEKKRSYPRFWQQGRLDLTCN